MVTPFLVPVSGGSASDLHPMGNYYDQNASPVRGVRDAGGIVVGGSDAPVDTRDRGPFINMAKAVSRQLRDLPPLNTSQSIPIRDAIDSYPISGARFLGWGRRRARWNQENLQTSSSSIATSRRSPIRGSSRCLRGPRSSRRGSWAVGSTAPHPSSAPVPDRVRDRARG
jgi:hypothetical protein